MAEQNNKVKNCILSAFKHRTTAAIFALMLIGGATLLQMWRKFWHPITIWRSLAIHLSLAVFGNALRKGAAKLARQMLDNCKTQRCSPRTALHIHKI